MGQVSERAIEIANEYVGKTESKANWGPWLEFLFARAGHTYGWKAGVSYCIAAAYACYAAAAKELGAALPLEGNASTQTFFDTAFKAGLTSFTPEIGDIVIFRLGD